MNSDLAISEVMGSLVLLGRACAGCIGPVTRPISCFCIDELAPALGAAHERLRWCSENCLYATHEEPTWPDLDELKWKEN